MNQPNGSAASVRPVLPVTSDSLAELKNLGLTRSGSPLRLHLGCGEQHFDGYVNVDYPPSEHTCQTVIGADVFADITKLRFPANTVDEYRLHHVFEHFKRSEALALIIIWHEALKVGGRVQIETPDIDGCAKQLASNIPFAMKQAVLRHTFGSQEASWAIHFDGWSEEKYRHVFGALGFTVQTSSTKWPHPPHLANVQCCATKTRAMTRHELLATADQLLLEYIVADVPSERGMCDVWRQAMRDFLLTCTTLAPTAAPVVNAQPAPSASAAIDATAKSALSAQLPIITGTPAALDKMGFDDDNAETNGEYRLIDSLISSGQVVFDVGANIGEWSKRVLNRKPGIRLHSFEPVPATFAQLETALAGTNASLHRFAFSEKAGEKTFFQFADQPQYSGMNSFYRRPEVEQRMHLQSTPVTIRTESLDGFLAREKVDQIDFLKIDTEGSELDVLRGAHEALAAGRIKLIQFEYGGTYRDAKITLEQVHALFAQHGYSLFRIAAEGLVPTPVWDAALENYRYSNYLATAPVSSPVKSAGETSKPLAVASDKSVSSPTVTGLVFSKDRAMQLDATLRSFFACCQDASEIALSVLCAASDKFHRDLYKQLSREYPQVRFFEEQNFRSDVLAAIKGSTEVLFLVDDNLFTQPFSITSARDALRQNADALGVSLRLGANTTYCYPVDRAQRVPVLTKLGSGLVKFSWTSAELDFNYPLEVSSSLFRTAEIGALCTQLDFNNPNTLEARLSEQAATFAQTRPALLCFERSVTFCNPVNKVQQIADANRAGSQSIYSAENLARCFAAGDRVDTSALAGFTPRGCHQEVELVFKSNAAAPSPSPAVSVIILCHNYAKHLMAAVSSVVAQGFKDYEIIILDDGSTDNSFEVAQRIAKECKALISVRVFRLNDVGPSAARRFGFDQARGRFLLPLDADDKLAPTFLEKTVPILEANPSLGFVYTDTQYFGDSNQRQNQPEYNFAQLCQSNFIGYCSLIRQEAFQAIDGYDRKNWGYYEDWDLWIRLGEGGWAGHHVAEPLFLYHHHFASSLSFYALRLDSLYKAYVVNQHRQFYTPETIASIEKVLTEMPRGWHERPPLKEIGAIQKLLAENPGHRHLQFFLAMAQHRQGAIAESIATLKDLLGRHPDDEQARNKLTDFTRASAKAAAPAVVENAGDASRIIALMSAYNEGDVIYHVIGDLIANGLHVYLIDNHSTDNTVAEASKWLGKGLLKVESFPGKGQEHLARCAKEYVWKEILRRKEDLSSELSAAWFLHVDADEFRESPWPGKTLAEGIRQVDALGYNAINFELLNFRPTDDSFPPGEDVRKYLPLYQPGEIFDAMQIKAWKKTAAQAQLVSNAGHSIQFAGRRVFPLNFILRHYPIRGETHGRRKVYTDRLPRFAREEVAQNWHIQYNQFVAGTEKFLHDPAKLVRFEGDRVRAALLSRFSQDVLMTNTLSGHPDIGAVPPKVSALLPWAGEKLSLSGPLPTETNQQAEQALWSLLQKLNQSKEDPQLTLAPKFARLLLVLLEPKLAYARLTGEAHLACLANRLKNLLTKLADVPAPKAAQASTAAETPGSASAQTGSTPSASEKIQPLVSICIPTYNGDKYLGEALKSALAQTYDNLEIIISDDASTDRTLAVAEEVLRGSAFPVTILNHQPSGMVANWENCVQHARGKYIKFLFQDDLLAPECVAELTTLAEEDHEIGLVFSPRKVVYQKIGDNDRLAPAAQASQDLHKHWSQLARIQAGTTLLGDARLFLDPVNKIGEPTTVLLAKAALKSVGGFDASFKQLVDADLWFRIMTKYKVGFVDRELSTFRVHEQQATQVNAQAGLMQQEWRNFFTKIARDPAFASMSEMHRSVATEALRRLEEKAAPVASAPANDDVFSPEEIASIELLTTAYSNNPADPEALGQLPALRQALMNFLVTTDRGSLEQHFKGGFGRVFRALVKSGLPSEPPDDEMRAQLGVLDEAIADAKKQKDFDYRPLLARMLRAPAHRGLGLIALEQIPQWALDDFLGYVFHAPQVFVTPGENETYRMHALAWTRDVAQRTQKAPDAALTIRAASFFASRANFIPLYFNDQNTRELSELRAAVLEYVLRKSGAALDASFPKRPADRKKIKVGYISAHFGAQTETHVTLPSLRLDRSKFEICLFPVSRNPGPIEDYARSLADSYDPLPPKLDQQVKRIRDAALDVVIIGTNVTAVTNQVSLLALHRLAPVQLVNYCSPVTSGMRHVDGFLSGTSCDRPGMQEHFSENLILCEGAPGSLDYSVESKTASRRFDRAQFGLGADEIVFVNAAACFKILPELQITWAKILQAVPKSKLLLLPFNPNWATAFPAKQFERTFTEICAQHGVTRDRFILIESLPSRADVKALEKIADIYLDTVPFSGSISVIDPLELGLPTIVSEGQTHRSLMAAALVRELGIPQLIAGNETEYIQKAVELAGDANQRRRLSEKILERMAQKPRFVNPEAYGQQLSLALEAIFARGKSPAPTKKKPTLSAANVR